MAELRDIVQSMVNSGETEENIAAVIKRYNALNKPAAQEDFPADDVEVKEDPSQEDVAVEGEDGASNGEESSSESQETEEDIRFNEVLAEIEKEQLTEEEVLEAETNANNVVDLSLIHI